MAAIGSTARSEPLAALVAFTPFPCSGLLNLDSALSGNSSGPEDIVRGKVTGFDITFYRRARAFPLFGARGGATVSMDLTEVI